MSTGTLLGGKLPRHVHAEESYFCRWVEGFAHEDGVSMQIGPMLFPLNLIYNTRTPFVEDGTVRTRVTRHAPGLSDFSLVLECAVVPGPFDGVADRVQPRKAERRLFL